MLRKIRGKLKGQSGFTLIETVITVAIIAVLTGLVSVGIYGYLFTSYIVRVNETAKTVFFASQSYILEQKQLGRLEEFNDETAGFGGDLSEDTLLDILEKNIKGFDRNAYKENYNTDTTRYVLYGKGSSDASNPLWHIVEEYVGDPKLLENTCLMEYDTKTGVVRAVFYSEKTDAFRYDGDEEDYGNVIRRTPELLEAKRQGYYGVDTTGQPYSEVYVEDPRNVMLVNRDRLYLQWDDINMANNEITDPGLLDSLIYDIDVYRVGEGGNRSDLLFKLKNVEPNDHAGDVTIDQADDLAGVQPYRLAQKKDTAKRTVTYQLILDDIHHSIYEIYGDTATNSSDLRDQVEVFDPVKAGDTLTCSVTAKLDKDKAGLEAYSLPASSNRESANFGGGDKYNNESLPASLQVDVGGSGRIEDGAEDNAYTVAYARHLNNMRHAAREACYSQTASMDWKLPEGPGRDYGEYFEPVVYQDQISALNVPYEGKYIVALDTATGKRFTLDNLSINKPAMQKVGLFSQNRGTIDGLTMGKPSVTGSIITGTVAGENSGTIKNITITEGNVIGSHFLGGVTGKNLADGSLSDIQADLNVSGTVPYTGTGEATNQSRGWYVGGIAGINEGKGKTLASAVLRADKKPQSAQRKVTGSKQVGGIFGANVSTETISDLVNNSLILLSDGLTNADEITDIGGIAGQNGEGTLSDCVNYGLIQLEKKGALAGLNGDTPKNIGGIAGFNKGGLLRCSNELMNNQTVENLLKTCTDASHLQAGRLPEYLGKYVGGIAGLSDKTGRIQACKSKGAVLGYEVVGGLVGKNLGNVSQTFSLKASRTVAKITGRAANTADVSGLVVGAGDMVGGIFGYNTGLSIKDYQNSAHVFGNGITGGITGFNGVAQEDGDEQILNLISNMGSQGTPAYYGKLLGIENLPLTASPNAEISGCRNEGFVYALKYYCGGIAGINYAKITQCDVEFVTDSRLSNISKLGRADCVGGVVGYNTGVIKGQGTTVSVELSANDFVGGLAGITKNKIEGYSAVKGNIYGKGDCVGGLIGLNNNSEDVISGLTRNEDMKIEGAYFVGGIIGCNVTEDSSKPTRISKITTTAKATIQGEAYVGGILGYNTYGKLDGLFAAGGELTRSKKEAYQNTPSGGGSAAPQVAVFSGCSNYAQVKANRYVGGMVGYNSALSQLWVTGCYNYGEISIGDQTKTGPSPDGKLYYYIGGITGRNSRDGVINHCSNDGSVKSPSTYLGGICEVNEGWVQYCSIGNVQYYVDDKKPGVEGDNSVGGIVGLNREKARVVSCQANEYAQIKGGNDTGGLVGTNDKGGYITDKGAKDLAAIGESFSPTDKERESVTHAYVNGKMNTGGIVGRNAGVVENILVEKEAQVIGTQKVGGFIGYNEGAIDGNSEKITGLVNNAKLVQGDNEVGGIVGGHTATVVEKCVNTGEVVSRDKVSGTESEPGYAGGIVGSVAEGVTVIQCVNYGKVVSNYSAAGGIAGYNQGTVRESANYGSVEGSTKRLADTSAIGGVVGHNAKGGQVLECASRDKRKDPEGEKNNPHYHEDETNRIAGGYRVGGIIGFNDQAVFLNEKEFNREVDITIEAEKASSGTALHIACIGGFIGATDLNPTAPATTVLADYIFSGIIRSQGDASRQQQCIGGIVGILRPSVTLENCLFAGKIEGQGNGQNDYENSGIGGLAGEAAGKLIVYPNSDGLYASNTQDSSVSGGKRVGGVAGAIEYGFEVVLKTGHDGAVTTDKYYVNLTDVQGVRGIGGFYGCADVPKLSWLENRGTVIPLESNGTAAGGILGYATTPVLTGMENCRNLGSVGDPGNYVWDFSYVGGLVGRWESAAQKTMRNCYNGKDAEPGLGTVQCGKNWIGGLVGNINNAAIEDSCKNWGNVRISNVQYAGGIAGRIENCVVGDEARTDAVTMNYGTITYLKNASFVGGIVGSINAPKASKIWHVANEGQIDAPDPVVNKGWTCVGGIAGHVDGSNKSVVGCVNKAQVNLQGSVGEVGGIIGRLAGNNLNTTVSFCKNEGKVITSEQAGGIVGYIFSSSNAQIHDNMNTGEINVRRRGGGLYGYIHGSSGVNIHDDKNTGLVSAMSGYRYDDVRAIGGCIGEIFGGGNITVTNETNQGQVRYDFKEEAGNWSAKVSRVGGIVGACSSTIRINNCRNRGNIDLALENGKSTWHVGGIIGALEGGVSYIGDEDTANRRTQNFGDITVSGETTGTVGGIAGHSAQGTQIRHAQNSGNIFTEGPSVGGIAGSTNGLIYSCINTGSEVRGFDNVGGLVGLASGAECKITSIQTGPGTAAEFDLSYNAAAVSGSGRVGGLIGNIQQATVYNLYNKGPVTLLARANWPTDLNIAGGIAGYARSEPADNDLDRNPIKGVIAGCYNFAPVRFAAGTTGGNYYIGGVLGYRQRFHQDEDQGAVSVVDCYDVAMEAGGVAETLPPTAAMTALWEIGNEPVNAEGKIFSDSDDYQAYDDRTPPADLPWQTDDKFKWNEEGYKKMCADAGITPNSDYTSEAAILELMQHYKGFRLPVPPMGPVIGKEGFQYVFPFEQLAGFYRKVGFKLYDGDLSGLTEEQLENEHSPFFEAVQERELGDQVLQIESNLGDYKDRIGKVVSVASYAEGYTQVPDAGGELHYTQDSSMRIVQKFVLMPPLPTPQIKVADVQEDDTAGSIQTKVKFEITNWAEYKKAAADVYASLRDLKDPDGNPYPIYDQFLEGLTQFTVKDTYAPSQNGGSDIIDTWILSLTGGSADGQVKIEVDGDKATFKIDYTRSGNFNTHGTANPWHKWEVQAIAEYNDRSLDPDAAGFEYRYLNSYKSPEPVYRLRTKLPIPTQLKVLYKGGTDPSVAGTPSYVMEWTPPAAKTGIKGYRVEISGIKYTGADGVPHTLDIDLSTAAAPLKREVSGSNSKSLALTKEELKAIVVDYLGANGVAVDQDWWDLNQPKFELEWQVISMSADETVYIESKPSAENTFELIRRAPVVENINVVRPDDRVNNINFQWTDTQYDAANPQNNRYRVEYTAKSGDRQQTATVIVTAKTVSDVISLTGDLAGVSTFTVDVKVTKLGTQGKDLDSLEVETSKVIGVKLDPVGSVSVGAYKIEADETTGEEYVYYDVSWVSPSSITGDNCEGYRIEAVLQDGTGEKQVVGVDGYDVLSGKVKLKLDEVKGKEMVFYVYARGKAPTSGDSDPKSIRLNVPNERLDPPELNTVKLSVSANSVGDGSPADTLYRKGDTPPDKELSVAKSDYEAGFDYQIAFDQIATAAISGTHLELICEGNTLAEMDSNFPATSFTVSANSIDLAGKRAAIKLSNRTADPGIRLPSLATEIEFTFPQVQLVGPGVTGFTKTRDTGFTKARDTVSGNDIYHVTYDQEKDGSSDETSLRKGQTVRILKKNGGNYDPVPFIPTDGDGNHPEDETDSYEIQKSDASVEFHFKFPSGTSYTPDELKKMKISIVNTVEGGGSDPEAEKYAPSLAAEIGFESVRTVTSLMAVKEELEEPEEDLQEAENLKNPPGTVSGNKVSSAKNGPHAGPRTGSDTGSHTDSHSSSDTGPDADSDTDSDTEGGED